MSKLEDFVPPLELCQRIPEGAFADSALAWYADEMNWWVMERSRDPLCAVVPAPMLEEILAELAAGDTTFESFDPKLYWNDFLGGWIITARGKGKLRDGIIDRDALRSQDRSNPATAALKLWLEVNKK